jgi:isoleucyl-tRNA synthetase
LPVELAVEKELGLAGKPDIERVGVAEFNARCRESVLRHVDAPYCTRDGTTLSDHEVAQGYETVTDPSVYVRQPLREPLAGHSGVDLLIWTTTPWTLVANTAVAVTPA